MKAGAGTAGKKALQGGDRVETEGLGHLQGCGAAPRHVWRQENCPPCAADAPLSCQSLLLPSPQRRERKLRWAKVVAEVNKLYMTINLRNL